MDGCGRVVPAPTPPPPPPQLGTEASIAASAAAAAAAVPSRAAADVSAQVTGQLHVVKRKRGRPPKSASAKQLTPPTVASKKHHTNTVHTNHNASDEEDVCFICFDGGDLVLCDRRRCPKAYHPTCIKRDEAFFKSKAKWNCGWHICSNCQRASHFLCYTCTFSLCKRCAGKADFLCVRENKGFCTTCMRTIMLIEDPQHGTEMVKVDFDDKSSWEYLFKVYWVYLKTKISLTLDELKKAKNPVAALMVGKGKTPDALYEPGDDKDADSDSFTGCLEVGTSKRKKTNRWSKFPDKERFVVQRVNDEIVPSPSVGSEWASKDLLEFVAHMRNGDTSILSQFDVQALLLDYIKRNNLRDPQRKSQIICDSRLKNMFGKPRVGHFEMLKLLEYHFLVKEDSHANGVVQGEFIGAVPGQAEIDEINGNLVAGKDKRRKTRRKGNDRGPPTNLDEYAAIDVHNINLIFLRRNLLENLIQDSDKFAEKVVGSVVRIKVTNNDQKQDMYRLVQVVGTSEVDVPYKIGDRMADCKLEVLNLNKKEVVSIDEISNQDFSEDECRRLRQCIKCGLAKRLSVGEVLDKAMALQAVKVNDLIEAEILRLNHLRDRASEKGHRKELRECVEKLQLLGMPEERHRRQHEVPEIHADPNMDPSHESDEDAREFYQKKQVHVGDNVGIVDQTGARKRGRKPNSTARGGEISNNPKSRTRKQISSSLDQNRSAFTSARVQKVANGSLRYPGRDAYGSNENPRNLYDPSSLTMSAWNKPAAARMESISRAASGTSIMSHSTGMVPSSGESEIEKMWHYQDPSGKIQGPFSMLQLRKWSTSGYFPPDLRIWKINEQQDNSLLLTDALDGLDHKKQRLNNSNDVARSSCASSWSNPADISSPVGLAGKFSLGRDSGAHDSFSNHSQLHSSLSSATFSEKLYDTTSHRGRETRDSETRHERVPNSNEMSGFQNSGDSYQKSSESSRQDLNNQPVNCSLSSGSFTSSIISAAKILSEMPGQNIEVDYSNLPSPTPKLSNEDSKAERAETTQVMPSNIPDPGTGLSQSSPSSQTSGRVPNSDPSTPTPKPIIDDVVGRTTESELFNSSDVPQLKSGPCESSPNCPIDEGSFPIPASSPCKEDCKVETAESNVVVSSEGPAQYSEPSCSGVSSLMNGVQLHVVANEWGGRSATPNHVEDWDSSPLPGSTLKPDDLATDLAVPSPPTPDQLALPSPSSLPPHASTWHAMVGGPNEFPLAEESVSDLLAEVDAMESLNGPASPTSAMNCSLEFAHDNKDDGFSADEALSPPPNPVKSDGFSSTGDVPLPQSFTKDEPKGGLHADVIDSQKVVANDSPCTEFEEEIKPADASANQMEADSTREPPVLSTTNWNIPEPEKDISRIAGPQARDTGWGKMQGCGDLGSGGQTHVNTNNTSWAYNRGATPPNLNWTMSPGHQGMWGNHPKFTENRFSSPRERNYHGGHSNFPRDRHSWNRQSSFSNGGGGGGGSNSSSRPLPKGQRVCKFHESGRCKKGASCSYLHPYLNP